MTLENPPAEHDSMPINGELATSGSEGNEQKGEAAAGLPTLADRIRDQARRSPTPVAGDGSAFGERSTRGSAGPVSPELRLGEDIHRFSLTSNRRILGRPVLAVKRVLRRLLHPVLARQVEYNRAATAALGELAARQDAEQSALSVVRNALVSTERGVASLVRDNIALRERLEAAEREIEGQKVARSTGGPEQVSAALELDYASFAERFRGSEAMIGERQRKYAERFAGDRKVVDLGCGRGEFLDLLRQQSTPACGVDLDPKLVEACVAQGLNAVASDAVSYLSELADGALGGIFSAHLIEHLEMRRVVALVRLAARKLGPGGVLVLETPNPESLLTLAKFPLDPTHLQPIHPELLRWLAEEEGFVEIELLFSGPADNEPQLPPLPLPEGADAPAVEAFNAGVKALNNRIYGPQDYALIARRGQR